MSTQPKKPWTVLVYMVADHEGGGIVLDPFADRELRAIIEAASLTDMHVAVQVDFKKRLGTFRGTVVPVASIDDDAVSSNGSLTGKVKVLSRLIERENGLKLVGRKQNAAGPKLLVGPEQNAADPIVLREFVQWAQEACPAERYAIFFWGHSFGPMGLFLDKRPGSHTVLRAAPLGGVAQAIGSLKQRADVLLFKDCFMSTLETAFEMQDVARFVIGSQSVIPIRGEWPYTDLFAMLQTARDGNEWLVARALAARLGSYYDDRHNRDRFGEVPMSLLDLDAIQAITPLLKTFVEYVLGLKPDAVVERASRLFERARAGRSVFDLRHPGDPALLDFAALLQNFALRNVSSELTKISGELAGLLGQFVPWSHSQGNTFHGVSIYYTSLNLRVVEKLSVVSALVLANSSGYGKLALNRETNWDSVAIETVGSASLPKQRSQQERTMSKSIKTRTFGFKIKPDVMKKATARLKRIVRNKQRTSSRRGN